MKNENGGGGSESVLAASTLASLCRVEESWIEKSHSLIRVTLLYLPCKLPVIDYTNTRL